MQKFIQGYSLRIGAFNDWLKKSKFTAVNIANRLNISEQELKSKLENKQIFNKQQITILVKLMGATSAFFIIHYPSFEFRKEVYFKVFKKEMKVKERKRVGVVNG